MPEFAEPLPLPGVFKTLPDGRRLTSRPKSGGMGVLEAIVLPPEGQLGDRLQAWGEAHITNGPGKCEVPGCDCGMKHIIARNKITGQGLIAIMNCVAVNGQSASTNGAFISTGQQYNMFSGGGDGGCTQAQALAASWLYVGTGTGATVASTTTLITAVTTKPNSTGRALTNPSAGVYRLSFTGTWNAGALSAITVTEIGVYGLLITTLGNTFQSGNQIAGQLFARLSVSDSEFSSFVVNTAAPLVIEYRFTLTFA